MTEAKIFRKWHGEIATRIAKNMLDDIEQHRSLHDMPLEEAFCILSFVNLELMTQFHLRKGEPSTYSENLHLDDDGLELEQFEIDQFIHEHFDEILRPFLEKLQTTPDGMYRLSRRELMEIIHKTAETFARTLLNSVAVAKKRAAHE